MISYFNLFAYKPKPQVSPIVRKHVKRPEEVQYKDVIEHSVMMLLLTVMMIMMNISLDKIRGWQIHHSFSNIFNHSFKTQQK